MDEVWIAERAFTDVRIVFSSYREGQKYIYDIDQDARVLHYSETFFTIFSVLRNGQQEIWRLKKESIRA